MASSRKVHFINRFNKDDLARRPLIENRGTRPVDIHLKIAGVSQVPEPAGGNFYEITRSYFTLEGEPADLATVPQGDRLVAGADRHVYGGSRCPSHYQRPPSRRPRD